MRIATVVHPSETGTQADDDRLLDHLAGSEIYRQFERAFCDATGLPLALRRVESWRLAHRGKRNENPLCALMARTNRACAGCLHMQQKVAAAADRGAHTLECAHGLTETAVPVRMGERTIGFLQTGQVFRKKKPRAARFDRVRNRITGKLGIGVGRDRLEKLYFDTPVYSAKRYESAVTLLTIFAEQLSSVGHRVLLQQAGAEPPAITRAKQFIAEHHGEDIALGDAARAANMSVFYFCKMFKKAAGLSFTGYLSRVRLERAKKLLLNPNLRVSEIAYEVGFQSLTHFNRVFRKVLGQSPSGYRCQSRVA